MIAAGGGDDCEWDDDGEMFCTGGDGGGDYPDPNGGGGGDDGGQIPLPITPPVTLPPTAGTPTDNGRCDPLSGICVITGKRPDPRTVDPETGLPLGSPSTPPDDHPWYCGLPIVGWLVCGSPQPSDIPNAWPPVTLPDRGPKGAVLEPHYSDELELCDRIAEIDRKKCDLDDVFLGGPVLRRKQSEAEAVGGVLPPSDLRQLKKANTEMSICQKKVDTEWGNCYKDAQNKWRIP